MERSAVTNLVPDFNWIDLGSTYYLGRYAGNKCLFLYLASP